MSEHHRVVKLLPVMVLIAIFGPALPGSAAAQGTSNKEVKAAGIMFDFDRNNHWMTIKADGDTDPVKYLIDPANKNLAESLKSVFNASRVRFLYKTEGEARRLVKIERQILQESGTVTGEVVKVHNNFWIELKPKRGVADAFAPGANYNDKDFMAKLKSLQPGDSVTIQYTTDFERHRIMKLRKNAPEVKPTPKAEQAGTPAQKK